MSISSVKEVGTGNPDRADQSIQSTSVGDERLFGGRKLNVCVLAYTFYNSDARVVRYAKTLHSRGHHVDVIALRKPGLERYEDVDGVSVYRIQERVVNERSQLTYLLRLLGFFFRSMAVIVMKHLSRPYDLIHVHSVPDFLVFAAWLPKLMGAKIILDIHDVLPEFYASKFGVGTKSPIFRVMVAIERISAAFSDHVIVANDIFRKAVVSRSVEGTKCTAILNYPDQSIFVRHGRNRVDDKFIILYPGTLNHHQGVDIAIRAFAGLKDQVPEAEFHIYGKGPQKSLLESMIQDLGLQGRVFLNDIVSLREISAVMENADLGIVPKRTDSFGNEAFSTKILEFMALGVPVLAAETKVERHYLDGSLIRFFRGGDEKDLADSMLMMMRDGRLRRRLAENGYEFIRHNNWNIKESLYLEILGSLFAEPARINSGPIHVHSPAAEQEINRTVAEYYRCPGGLVEFALAGKLSGDAGYFSFGQAICYGQSSAGVRATHPLDSLYDLLQDITMVGATVCLPFDPSQVVGNLRCERYEKTLSEDDRKFSDNAIIRRSYYLLRPLLSISVRKYMQRAHLNRQRRFPAWPLDRSADSILQRLLALSLRSHGLDKMPFIWFWPDGFQSCLIMTHDVETKVGRDFCSELMDLDDSFGIKSSFGIVPEQRYAVSGAFLDSIRGRGFEVNVHDLNHDGQLFTSRKEFLRRAERINQYGREYRASGFRSGALYREPDWYDALEFSYDMSIPNSAHLDAQRGGCCTIMPYFIGDILELPVTMTQDYSLFHILNTYTIDLWKSEIASVTGEYGLANFIVHPDYIQKKRALDAYKALLQHLSDLRSDGTIWTALPREVNDWWRQRKEMRLVYDNGKWRVEGEGKERARIAYASLDGDTVRYTLEGKGNREQGTENRLQVSGDRL